MGDFGERLKKSRKARNFNFTMLALGKKVGVAKSTAGYESGFRTPSLDVIVAIATTLNMSTDYLLGFLNTSPSYIQQTNDIQWPTTLGWNRIASKRTFKTS